jgi:hypothetical protein
MLTFLQYTRTAWSDYFTGSPTHYNSQTYDSRPTLSGTNVYISNCLFRSITSTGEGGALYCTSVTCFLVESTSFFSCKSSKSHGGAIYFYNSGGQCVLHEVCGYDCSNLHSTFAYIQVNDAASSKIYIDYSSIANCVNSDSGSYTLCLVYGNISCPSVNMSVNKCGYRTIYCWPFVDSNSVICSFSYSSFTDNIATIQTCFFLYRTGPKYEIKNCNILRNTQVSSSEGTISTWGNLMIEDSCILENTATYIFYTSSCTITLSNCTVDKTTKNGNLVTQNTVTKSFIHALNHMSTRNCHSEYDSAGTLTPILQSPSSSRKQIRCYTYGRCICHPRLTDTFSPIFVFIFDFIHSGSSYYP